LKLSSVHYGQFWTSMRNEYPLFEDKPPIAEGAQGRVEVLEMPPLRRMFLLNSDASYLMQIQPDRFFHNWRKTTDESHYPHFEANKQRFLSAWRRFTEFTTGNQLGSPEITHYELTYVNQILSDPGTFPPGIEKFVPLFSWSGARSEKFLPDPNKVALDLSFALPQDKGRLRIVMNHGIRTGDNRDVMQMQFSASGPAGSARDGFDNWFEVAHESIVRGFCDVTSLEAHKIWGRNR